MDIELDPGAQKYQVLVQTMLDYFPTADDPEDRSGDFVRHFRANPSNVRYSGLTEEIKLAVQNPSETSALFNEVMGWDFSPKETREYFIDLYDRLMGVDKELEAAKADTSALMGYYITRRVKLPFLRNDYPLWGYALSGLAIALAGLAGVSLWDDQGIVTNVFNTILIAGVVIFFVTLLTMYFLRDEVVNHDRNKQRELVRHEEEKLKDLKKSRRRFRG